MTVGLGAMVGLGTMVGLVVAVAVPVGVSVDGAAAVEDGMGETAAATVDVAGFATMLVDVTAGWLDRDILRTV
jgi:hypothetical protein